MTGVDVHVDTNIGKHITALGQTLTTLTGKVLRELFGELFGDQI